MLLPCTAYLRVYEPLSAFPEDESRVWAAYAASPARPRRAGALAAEQEDAVHRLTAHLPVAVPPHESADAYVRWAGGMTFICPWQTRLRSWLALAWLADTLPPLLAAAFPGAPADAAAREFERWQAGGAAPRVHIQSSGWSVPCAWFAPFAPDERWLVLGTPGEPGDGGRATASATRTLVYATTMAQARARVSQALQVTAGPGAEEAGDWFAEQGSPGMVTGLAEIERWLLEFDPASLVELDYGGLVHLLDDGALRADQSVAEVTAAIRALTIGERELATAMQRRLTRRWQAVAALAIAS